MVKKAILLFTATACFAAGAVKAQLSCITDDMMQKRRLQEPNVAVLEAQFKAQMDAQLGKLNLANFKTTLDGPYTFQDTVILHVPIVFHVIHDYGVEYVSDNDIYRYVDEINALYSRTRPDTNTIIAPYRGNIPGTTIQYASNTHIRFHLATKDPLGNPTHGITRYRNFSAKSGGDHAKYDIWPRESYINLWIVDQFDASHAGAGGYAYQPAGAQGIPYWDGVILASGNLNDGGSWAHEIGHSLNLNHTWGSASGLNGAQPPCGDDDVDDTPPTHGHTVTHGCVASNLYDSTCATGYSVLYSKTAARDLFNLDTLPVVINYPDTTNAQNTMDYTGCDRMFTYLQGVRMREALRNNIAGRNSLIDTTNLILTGVMDQNYNIIPRLDLAPIADFSVNNPFVCRGTTASANVSFINRSWNDTVSSIQWTFSNNALTPTSTSTTNVINRFDTPGWVTVNMIVNSNAGSDTLVDSKRVYVADDNATSAVGYFQEFNQGGDLDKYPIFNYFNNFTKWEVVNNAGYFDNTSICYKQYDIREYPSPNGNITAPLAYTGTPRGDYDDFYTPAFDLSQMGNDNVYLTFYSAGTFRTHNVNYMLDALEIAYSTNCSGIWNTLKTLTKSEIGTGTVLNEFTPSWYGDWQGQNILLPASVKNSGKIIFRFRFKPGVTPDLIGSGNNFYLDRIHLSNWTTDVNDLENKATGVALAPNPTTGSTFVVIKDAKSKTAQITVTDVTGKLVYSTQASLNNNVSRIEIPANYIAVKGMYLVSVTTGAQKQTEKLVVY